MRNQAHNISHTAANSSKRWYCPEVSRKRLDDDCSSLSLIGSTDVRNGLYLPDLENLQLRGGIDLGDAA